MYNLLLLSFITSMIQWFSDKSFTTRAKPVSQLCFIYTFVLFPTNCKVRNTTLHFHVAKLSLNRWAYFEINSLSGVGETWMILQLFYE